MKRERSLGLAGIGLAVFLVASLVPTSALQVAGQPIAIDNDDIAGVVTGPKGPGSERLGDCGNNRSADQVRQDRGDGRQRTLSCSDLPQSQLQRMGARLAGSWIPEADGRAWQDPESDRGHRADPARRAGSIRLATGSLLRVPDKSEFPGKGDGVSPNVKSQAEWIRLLKSGAVHVSSARHDGNAQYPARPRPFPNSSAAWERRLGSGQAGTQMLGQATNLGRPEPWRSSPTGPIASLVASCRRRRRGRRGWSATWW